MNRKDRTITAENIVLGVGQRNARLNIPGQEYLHGSREFLDIEEMPEHLICIGAGIISMEFASMALIFTLTKLSAEWKRQKTDIRS